MTTTQTTAHPAGTVIATRRAGAVLIQIVKALGGFSVLTWAGPDMVTGWCDGYTTWDEARAAANHTRDAYRLHKTTTRIEARRQHLIAERDDLLRRHDRNPGNRTYPQLVAGIDRELDTLEDLSTRALAPRFVADVTRFLSTAA